MDKRAKLEADLSEWIAKVFAAYDTEGMTDTYFMIADVDNIISKAFDHSPVLS